MRWNVIICSYKESNVEIANQQLQSQTFCEVNSALNVENAIEIILSTHPEIVIICDDVTEMDSTKFKKIATQIIDNIVIIENFNFKNYNIISEIKKAINLYNLSHMDLFDQPFSLN